MPDVYQKISAVAFDMLPEAVQQAHCAPPVAVQPVQPDGAGFSLLTPHLLDHTATQALLPKLGIKSWRDSGSLGVVYIDVNILTVTQKLLQHPTAAQKLLAPA